MTSPAIDGALPRHRWERAELAAVLRALEEAHDLLTPSPAPHLESAASHFQNVFGGWAELAGTTAPSGLDPWCAARLQLLAGHAPSRRADPDVVTVLLAEVSGFLVSHALRPSPPGLPTLRRFQAAQGEVAVGWLRRRLTE